MQLGTVKYSGSAIKAGLSAAALSTAALAASMFSLNVLCISMWSRGKV